MRKFILAAALLLAANGTAFAQSQPEQGKKFGDWAVGCRQFQENKTERCVLFQNIVLRQSGKRVLSVQIARPAKDKPYIVGITAPLGILLPAGLTLQVDEKELVKFQLRLCNVNGCQGQFPLTADVQRVFAAGKNGRVVFRQPNGRPLRVQFSLNGFEDGFADLDSK